jgi:hypothetical protein
MQNQDPHPYEAELRALAAMPLEPIWNDASFSRRCEDHEMKLSGEGLDDSHIPALVEFLEKNPQITFLNLSMNRLGPEGATRLAGLRQIKVLDISYNDIGNEGAIALAGSNIEELNLCTNNIGNEGAIALAGSNIKKLDLSVNNHIGNEGVSRLAANPIIELVLSQNLGRFGLFPLPVVPNDPVPAISAEAVVRSRAAFEKDT